jgi:hypothetical protein
MTRTILFGEFKQYSEEKRELANRGQDGPVDSGQDPAARNAEGTSHE